jgi:1-acyl-sn-glycerol-3-phosphate acyltransferase
VSGGKEATATIPPADLLPVGRRPTIAFRLARALAGPLLRLVFRIRVEGRANLLGDRPHVIIANHLNWLDYWLLLLVLPPLPRVHFLANPSNLLRHPLHWRFVRAMGGYIPVDLSRQADPALFAQVHRCLRLGGAVAFFPEAAYGDREGELGPFKKGFAHFAVGEAVPVLPVALSGTKELWLRKTIRVMVGPAIPPEGHDAGSMLEASRTALAAILPAYQDPPGPKPMRKLLTHLLY